MMRTFWMNAVDPFTDLAALEAWMDRTIQDVLHTISRPAFADIGFVPPVDICEDGDRLLLRVEVPGLSEQDFNLTLQGNVLTIKGERRLPEGVQAENFTYRERPYGSFVRTVTLPSTVDPTTISATYSQGILEISLSKRAEFKAKQIPVQVVEPKQLAASANA
jgi:HSP20 family protein